MRIDYGSITDNELKKMYQLCAMEMEKRKTQKQTEAWKKAIEALREYVQKYGLTVSIDGEEMVLDENCSDEDFEEIFYSYGPGVIYQRWE